ncbi:MAG: hypothetical protein M3373_13275 [Gemmatimonadota bacterium]|nr:hypothetical protein [Gemmatimonadota bacterium]
MTSPSQRSALALAEARAVVDRIDPAADPEDIAANLIEGWTATEGVLRAMIGGSSLSGQALVGALRQRHLLSLDQAHTLLEFLAAHDRASLTEYHPTDADIASSRAGIAALEEGWPNPRLDAPQLADTTAYRAVSTPSEPVTGRGNEGLAREERLEAHGRVSRRGIPAVAILGGALALLVALAVAAMALRPDWFGAGRRDVSRSLRDGIEAYNGGRLARAREEFEQAARDHSDRALPLLWLARVARDQRDDVTAARVLSRAEQLEPGSSLVHREIGNFHMARQRWDAARERYVRAVQADTTDHVATGWLGCALVRLGRIDEGSRFLRRAGPGDWTRCAAQTLPPTAQPGAPPPAMR